MVSPVIDHNLESRLRRLLQIALVLLVVFAIAEIDWKIRGPESSAHQSRVVREFNELQPFPGSSIQDKRSSVKAGMGSVSTEYQVQGKTQDEVEQWYRSQLEKQNWKFVSIANHLGKRQIKFCRNGETTRLDLPEEYSNTLIFDVMIGWGSSYSC